MPGGLERVVQLPYWRGRRLTITTASVRRYVITAGSLVDLDRVEFQ